MNELSVLQNFKEVRYEPYPHIMIENALPEKIYNELDASFPETYVRENGSFHSGGTSGDGPNYRYKANPALIDKKMPNIWLDFFEYHTSYKYFCQVLDVFDGAIDLHCPQYKQQLHQEKLGTRGIDKGTPLVTDCQVVIHDPINYPMTSRTPHLDNPAEIYAGLLYMRQKDDVSTGGNFTIHKTNALIPHVNKKLGRMVSNELHAPHSAIPYQSNVFGMFLNIQNSVHSVTPREEAILSRRSINIIGEFARNRMWNIPNR